MHIEIDDFATPKQKEVICYALEKPQHLIMTGPRGSGKTQLVAWAARKYQRPFAICHFGNSTDVEATLQGTTRLKNHETVFTRSRFIEAVTTPNCVVALDEINRSGDPRAQGILMSAMDDQRTVFLEQEEPGRQVVHLAEGVVLCSTANIGASYSGTESLDPAFLDRMLKLKLGYSKREPEILRRHGLGARDTRRVMKIATEVRKQYESGAMTDTISTRGLVMVAGMVVHGFEIPDAFGSVVGTWDVESETALRTICKVAR